MNNEIIKHQDNLPERVGERLGQIFVIVFAAYVALGLLGVI